MVEVCFAFLSVMTQKLTAQMKLPFFVSAVVLNYYCVNYRFIGNKAL